MFDSTTVLKVHDIMPKTESIDKGYKIPNIFHFTFCNKNLPIEILRVIEHNKKICRNCSFIFYDDADCDNLLKTYFHDEIYNAYNKINPTYGAMRADFFRYCVLYLYGGIYIDIKSKITHPIFQVIHKNDVCILDIPRSTLEHWRENSPTYEQWLLIFAPRHPYLLSVINLLVKHINEKFVPESINGIKLDRKGQILNITGPDAFTKGIQQYNYETNKILHRSVDYTTFSKLNCEINYRKMYKMNNKKHYSESTEPLFI